MNEIMKNGPVSAGMKIYADFLNYTGGVYVRKSDEYHFGHLIRFTDGMNVFHEYKYWF